LTPVAKRVEAEGYNVLINPIKIPSKNDLKIVDEPERLKGEHSFCIGASHFSDKLQELPYNRFIASHITPSQLNIGFTPIYLSCWFNGVDFVYPPIVSTNVNMFMEGDLGQEVPSMGCVGYACKPSDKLFTETLFKLKPILRKVNYCGFMTLVFLFHSTYIYPYFLYDLLYAFLEGVQEEIGRALHDITLGNKKEFVFPDKYIIAVRFSIPPYPYPQLASMKLLLRGYNDKNAKHIWLQDAIKTKTGVFSDGGNGVTATVTARGNTVRECKRRVYRTVSNLSMQGMQYRRDIGIGVEKLFKQCHLLS
jgi:phosphoribosylamine-glycine ligase